MAFVAAVLWNWIDNAVDRQVQNFVQTICSVDATVFCHRGLMSTRRTQRAQRAIPRGETVLEIPRKFQIWDRDALKDPFIQNELLTARMPHSNQPFPSGAFLAAHLARLLRRIRLDDKDVDIHPVLVSYLRDVLPTYASFVAFHPILWTDDELVTWLGAHSSAFSHVLAFRNQIQTEYDALTNVSDTFANQVSLQDFQTARLNVMTRSFGTGEAPLESSWNVNGHTSLSDLLLRRDRGTHAMVPVLDLYDHHPQPNVEFSYSVEKAAFVVSAIAPFTPGQEVFDSYGKRTDSDLFARYGFVNGDGSGWTEANLALFHIIDRSIENAFPVRKPNSSVRDPKQRLSILHYLQYDDGYPECVHEGDVSAWELKQLKFQYLLSIGGEESSWVARMSPRNSKATPPLSRHVSSNPTPPPAVDLRNVHLNASMLFGTCRLISLTHNDYDGNATEVLRHALQLNYGVESAPALLPVTNDALEFRTLLCMARMSSTALSRFERTIGEQQQYVSQLNKEAFGSRNWTVAHLHLGEMQTLELIKKMAFVALRRTFGDNVLDTKHGDPAFSLREQPCPLPYLTRLLDFV